MLTVITIICLFGAVGFPTFMLMLVYPFSKKAALFWSNYISRRSSRLFFAILRCYRGYMYLPDKSRFKDLPEQFLVISNHQSLIDIVLYLHYFRGREIRFVAKDTLRSVPMVGKMLHSQRHCMIPRKGSPTVAMKHLENFGSQVVREKQDPVIFPEGTRSRDGKLGQFYSAGFRRLSQSTHLPVVACALDGGWKLSKVMDIMKNLRKGSYRVKILKIYPAPQGKEDEKMILEESKALIQSQLDEWRALPPDSLSV